MKPGSLPETVSTRLQRLKYGMIGSQVYTWQPTVCIVGDGKDYETAKLELKYWLTSLHG